MQQVPLVAGGKGASQRGVAPDDPFAPPEPLRGRKEADAVVQRGGQLQPFQQEIKLLVREVPVRRCWFVGLCEGKKRCGTHVYKEERSTMTARSQREETTQ